MTSGNELDPKERIARRISRSQCAESPGDGQPGVLDSDAFMPRADCPPGQGLEEYISVTRVESFSGEFEDRLRDTTRSIVSRWRGRDPSRLRIGLLRVSDVHEAAQLKPKSLSVRIVDPTRDQSYAGIYGMDLTDAIIAQELARRALLYAPRLP